MVHAIMFYLSTRLAHLQDIVRLSLEVLGGDQGEEEEEGAHPGLDWPYHQVQDRISSYD